MPKYTRCCLPIAHGGTHLFVRTAQPAAYAGECDAKENGIKITNERCVCLTEQPIGIRPGPNAKTRMEADPKCGFCYGSGYLTITVEHDPPGVPLRGADWNAIVDGCEETGPVGYGSTKQQAVENLLIRLEEVQDAR